MKKRLKRRRSRRILMAKNGGLGIRKIYRLGHSAVVSIPHEYLTSRGIKPGDEVFLRWNGDLLVSPLSKEIS
jgi:hypothetical protein